MEAEYQKALQRNPHLGVYIQDFVNRTGNNPEFVTSLSKDIQDDEYINLLLPVGDPVFIHLYGTPEMGEIGYYTIEPPLNDIEKAKYNAIMDIILERSASEPVPKNEEKLKELIAKLLNEAVDIGAGGQISSDEKVSIIEKLIPTQKKIPVTQQEFNNLQYHIERNIIGSGPIEPIIRDPHLEDIHSIGVAGVFIVHKILGMMKTDLSFGNEEGLDHWLRSMSERIGRPVSDARPIADGALPDGSRINIIYSLDVSKRGSSFTMRKFSEVPVSIIELIMWGAISCEMGAYMWMCLENGMSVFFSGETASGKTTMLNACLAFVNPKSKIFTAEDTAEVQPPQPVWQQLITREDGPPDSRVDTFALLKAALRSRPNYIIVGEIRGEEGAVAFQGMQTGHPVMATFHASAVTKMIQRLTGDPINVPVTFIDNLNVAMILQAVYRKGKFLRRCLAIEEIEGYYEDAGGVVTRAVFQWDPDTDTHNFRGLNNSFILENKIATKLGYEDKRQIYSDLMLRARILEEMKERGIKDYYDVLEIVTNFYKYGVEGLPFAI
ncbi:type II/IV secretion system ATPase subunit [Methanococcoides methylutens]|uniref:Flagella-related protein FlaI n=1 Tax=Methanococcoides methylutens MM1 TaxID=1434104 RepID=A0A0E3STJ6_METMT|nr:type II/IV secretion system ATPase subunit [Methanococcoides methylutens]AKB86138.1 Flagella-related protein FlaI [Methanococcoides methylutens MM1]